MNYIINNIVNIATFATAIGTLLTVREMNKQRKASYRPELILASVDFSAHYSSTYPPFPINWLKIEKFDRLNCAKKKTEDVKELVHDGLFTMPLLNIGLGAAKEITGFWSFPILEIVKEINHLAQKELFILRNEELATTGYPNITWRVDKKIDFDYVLPIAIQKEFVAVRIPIAYIALVSALIYISVSRDRAPPRITPLELSLEYFDISGVKYKTKINISFELTARSQDFFVASLQPRKIAL